MSRHAMSVLSELRVQPTPKRVRALVGDQTALDSTRALLVWEPKQPVPSYAVPTEDIQMTIAPVEEVASTARMTQLTFDSEVVPIVDFGGHSAEGTPLSLIAGDRALSGAAFRVTDPALDGYLILDFDAFDSWLEEDEPIVGHPRDPFHRIDVRRSSRQVRASLDGVPLAESNRAEFLFEDPLPVRYYFPPEAISVDLRPSDRTTTCAYKGHASYYSVDLPGDAGKDLAWTYLKPLPDCALTPGYISFFNERVDLDLDGQRLQRPRTPWS